MKWQKKRLFKKKMVSWAQRFVQSNRDNRIWRWHWERHWVSGLSPMLKRDGGKHWGGQKQSHRFRQWWNETLHKARQAVSRSVSTLTQIKAFCFGTLPIIKNPILFHARRKKEKYGNKSIILSAPALQHSRRAAGWNFAKCRSLVTHHLTHYLSYC